MNPDACAKVVEEVQSKAGLDTKSKAMAAISGVCQRSGTNRSASAVTVSYTIDGKEVTSKILAEACSKHIYRGDSPSICPPINGNVWAQSFINTQSS